MIDEGAATALGAASSSRRIIAGTNSTDEDAAHSSTPETVELALGQTWPSRERFGELAEDTRVIPVVRRVFCDDLSAVAMYSQLADQRVGTFLFESAEHDGTFGRWSFIGAGSAATLTSVDDQAHWDGVVPEGVPREGKFLDVLEATLREMRTPRIAGLPPLTGAFVGALGWGVIPQWEPTLRAVKPLEVDIPDAVVNLATDVAAIDHADGSVWLIANAYNLNNTAANVDTAYDDCLARLDSMVGRLASPIRPNVLAETSFAGIAAAAAAEGVESPVRPEISFRTAKEDYLSSVVSAKQAIRDGEVFQVVVAQRLDVETPVSGLDVYRVLRTVNPSPYLYCMRLSDGKDGFFDVVGSSPETLVKVEGRRVWTYPIAGSRPRGATAADDRALVEDLLSDPKELSEHTMLVDLARNDLSKVCDPATVEVSTLMEIKRFSHIQHISSTVTGVLREDADALDCLTATFPAGTLSGAPKPRAIQLIDELEPAARGVYGGVVGYFDLSGDADFAIAIRTATISNGVASVEAGGGLVADSVPELEYQESRNKAAAAVESVRTASTLARIDLGR